MHCIHLCTQSGADLVARGGAAVVAAALRGGLRARAVRAEVPQEELLPVGGDPHVLPDLRARAELAGTTSALQTMEH